MHALKTLFLSVSTSFLLASSALAHNPPEFEFTDSFDAEIENLIIFMGPDGVEDLSALALDGALSDRLSAALKLQDFKGEFGQSLSFKALAPYKKVSVVGTGSDGLQKRDFIDLGGYAAALSSSDSVTILTGGVETKNTAAAAYIAQGYALRSYKFDKYQQDADDGGAVAVEIITPDAKRAETKYSKDLSYVVEGIYVTRDLGNEPGNKLFPQSFVERVVPMFEGLSNVKIDVLDADAIQAANMGALWGSGRGSINDPRLLVISYTGGETGKAPLALVGKGITFDTGGISLKPNTNMWYMKSDLSGAAAVAGTVYAAASRGEDINLVGVMPLSENMPSQDAIRPGDVLETMGGKTIEVGSTDAEGRLVLADAVQYTQEKFEPYMLLDIATLTGSAASALGTDYAAVISRDLDSSLDMMEIGEQAGEEVWPLPLNDNHFKKIKSDIADIVSTAGRPGASIGAAVIGTFIDDDLPWIHLDIAGVDWMDGTQPTVPKGHAGWGVRFMDELIREEAGK